MSKLSHLRAQLQLLRLGRRLYRWGAAWSAVLAVAAVALLVLLAVDVAFEPDVAARVVMLVLAAAVVVAAVWRLARPWLFVRETVLDIALLVERRMGHPGQTDLAAALQFESPGAAAWGSPQLEQAVIDRVGTETRNVSVFAGSSASPLARRVAACLLALAAAVGVAILWPQHVAVFFDRMALGGRHYPTETAIERIVVNGRTVLEGGSFSSAPQPARCAEGQPLRIAVHAGQELPEEGELVLVSKALGQRRTVPLRQVESGETASGDPERREVIDAAWEKNDGPGAKNAVVYLAELDRLMEPLEYQVFLGDAWTDPAEIVMVPLPVVEPRITVVAPDYAQAAGASGSPSPGARQISVLEGSRIEVEVAGVNEKPLAEVELVLKQGGQSQRFPLVPIDDEKLRWRLESDRTPLDRVTEEFRYAIETRDEDGLRPASPITGVVRIRPDRPPRVAARSVTRVVLPTAAPVVNLDLADDFGVRRPELELKITRENGSQETRVLTDLPVSEYNEEGRLASQEIAFPLTGDHLPWRGGCRVDLAPLELKKGDRVAAVFLVSDYRGQTQTDTAQAASQPLEFEVSDEAGVYRAALETDRQALEDITQAADLQQELLKGEK